MLEVGAIVGDRFRIEHILGKGGMGIPARRRSRTGAVIGGAVLTASAAGAPCASRACCCEDPAR